MRTDFSTFSGVCYSEGQVGLLHDHVCKKLKYCRAVLQRLPTKPRASQNNPRQLLVGGL